MAQKHQAHATEIMNLKGMRLVTSGEVEEGAHWAEAKIKELTGDEAAITARRMREDEWDFRPTHLLWLHANHRPQIVGTDNAIWRRVLLIPWDVVIPVGDRVPTLADDIVELIELLPRNERDLLRDLVHVLRPRNPCSPNVGTNHPLMPGEGTHEGLMVGF